MSGEKAHIFSLGGAKLVETNISTAERKLSGAPKEALESNYELPLTPMKDYAQAVEQYSGASLNAFKKIFAQPMVPMQEAENVPSLQNPLVEAIERGFNNPLLISEQNDSLSLSEKARAAIDVLFATPKSLAKYVEGKAAEFLVNKTPVGALVKALQIGLSSGLPSDIKQISHGRVEALSLREIVATNVSDSTKQVMSQLSKRSR
ncbi:MAG: hypothetical protein IJS88_03855 [Alphaproteobacteria bacterium]|nr:hypothetical protein [Alphaproteobacteria bacterium]